MTVIKSKPISVLLISESSLVIFGLQRLLDTQHPSIVVTDTAISRNAAVTATQDPQLDVALIDIDGSMGVELVNEVVSAHTCRVLVMTATTDPAVIDAAVAFGASGIVRNTDPVETYVKALEKVAEGELWLDRATTGRIFLQMSRNKNGKGQEQNPEQTRIEKLTRKERMTVAEFGRDAGASRQEIAERLHISEHTLRNHLTSIYAKLELSSRVELYAFAQRNPL